MTASEALGTLKDDEAIPHLIHALSVHNYRQEGSEEATVHTIMKSRIIGAIRAITGLTGGVDTTDIMDVNDPRQLAQILRAVNDRERINSLISETKAWARQHNIQLLSDE